MRCSEIKKKILLISCKGLGRGGVQAVLMSIVRNLSSIFTFDIVLFTNVKGFYEEEFLSYGGNIYRVTNNSTSSICKKIDFLTLPKRIYEGTKKIILQHGPYVAIHCNNYHESAYCLKAASKTKIPVRISHIHACVSDNNWLIKTIHQQNTKQINKYATHKIACSKEAFASVFGEKEDPGVILNSYNSQIFKTTQKSHTENIFNITQIGYFSPNNNQIFTIRVLAHLKKLLPNVKLNLVGFDVDGYQSVLKYEIAMLGLENEVIFCPSDVNLPELLSHSTISMIPSIAEGFCIVAVESQAMGVPVFASDTLPSASNAGGCIYLSLNLGPEEWANQIFNWYQENKDKTFSFDCSQFEEENIIQKYKELYEANK